MQVTLIDRELNPGGVCVYRGCIPSKALLHAAKLLTEAKHASAWGLHFAEPRIDLDQLRGWKNQVVAKLTGGTGSWDGFARCATSRATRRSWIPRRSTCRPPTACSARVVRPRDPRNRVAAEHHPEPAAGQPARDGLQRRTRAARYPENAARGGRLHRARARHRLRRTRVDRDGGRDDAGAAAGGRPRSRRRAREARAGDVRGGAAPHEGGLDDRRPGRCDGDVRERQPRALGAGIRQGARRSGVAPTRRSPVSRTRRSRSTRRGSSRPTRGGGRPNRLSMPSATSRRAHARPQGVARGAATVEESTAKG